ncbi:universal stress protein [Sphaerisporangium sp. TRM90804]|uniref:universal stress protein n=1 Tax=Sphaerisporangium sp. TRM90804 TaxID=3031113 RepID=UPI00244C17DA|nr:universal stress protein [Sphaerisporangium sp. TRM90804]MDH2430822.1 universal stress protein [Sphaerisporangium sp. TRM90804]
MTNTIVVGVDGSPAASAAVEWAADDAARGNAALRIVHVREQWGDGAPFHAMPGFEDSLSEYCDGVVAAAAARARQRAPGIEVETVLARGAVVETLTGEAERAEEVVLGSRGMGGFAGLVLGSVGMAMAGHAPGPVVIVRGRRQHVFGEIVVGFDGSPGSEAALEYAFDQARARHARLRVVHAWQTPVFSPFALGYSDLMGDVFRSQAELFQQRLDPWKGKHPEVTVAGTAVCEHPTSALSDASRDADLVVVGSRGLGGVGSALLGSVSHGVLHRAHCPVAVVRPRPDR